MPEPFSQLKVHIHIDDIIAVCRCYVCFKVSRTNAELKVSGNNGHWHTTWGYKLYECVNAQMKSDIFGSRQTS